MKTDDSSRGNGRTNSIHASLRQLLALGLSKSSSAEPQKITRTVKFKINTSIRPELVPLLNQHFDAFEKFRRKVLNELEARWNKNQKSFQAMVQCSAKEPYQEKTSCYAWLDTHFITEAKEPTGLPRKPATSLLYNLSGGLKSFLTRRETVTEDIQKRFNDNLQEWNGELRQLADDLKVSMPPAPPTLNFENLTESAIERYNDWVGRTRAWCNLILVQQKKVERRDACLPRYLKGYPGFFGSQRYAATTDVAANLKKLEEAAVNQSKKAAKRFTKLSSENWTAIQERFSPAEFREADEKRRPRSTHQTVCARLFALQSAHPDWTPLQFAEEILAGIFRGTEKLKRHLASNGYEDRRAIIKLANLYNVATAFALEPVRVAGDYVAFYEEETPKRNAFGDARGGLHQPSNESAAIEIMGFGLQKDSGKPLYNGLLVCKKLEKENDDSWAFLYCHSEGQMFELASEKAKLRGKLLTDWTGFASRGGSRKKAEASAKRLVRGRVWVSEKTPPSVFPLAFGSRQGREYLWHFDRDLREKNEWVLGNGRLLRIMPPGRPNAADFYLTLTLERQAPPLAEITAENFIGIDRGEAVPAAYAVVDKQGKLLTTGKIAEYYRGQQRDFDDQKRELQRTQGGYPRWLRSKGRNRARALSGEVTRAVLALAAKYRAPVVLENLNSSIATRGGKRTLMTLMQYQPVQQALEQKFLETGLWEAPKWKQKSPKKDNGFIKLIDAWWTSRTCSRCGNAHSSEFYEKMAETLGQAAAGKWSITVCGQSVALPEIYQYRFRGEDKEANTNERLQTLFKGKCFKELTQKQRERLTEFIEHLLPYRPDQASFHCLNCGYKTNADTQAALNIARKFLFETENPPKKGEKERRLKWQAWYQQKLATVWK